MSSTFAEDNNLIPEPVASNSSTNDTTTTTTTTNTTAANSNSTNNSNTIAAVAAAAAVAAVSQSNTPTVVDPFNSSDSLNRFNNIINSLPLKTRLTISSLSLLDNITTQLLRLLIFNSNAPHLLALLTDQSNYLASGETETFQILLKLFKQIKNIYNPKSPLLNVHDVAPGLWFPNSPPPMLLRGHEAFIITVIRKTNLLTFILTTLHCFNYGFDLLQSTFLDIFCPNTLFTGTTTSDQNGKFLKSQAILYLDLKTQALIAGLKESEDESGSIPRIVLENLLDEIFPQDLADQLIQRRCGGNSSATNTIMTPSEQDFIERCTRRRENLLQFNDLNELISSYDWNHFIKELLDYCNKNMGLIIWGKKGRGKSPLYCYDVKEFDAQIIVASGAVPPTGNPDLSTIDSTSRNNATIVNDNGELSSITDSDLNRSNLSSSRRGHQTISERPSSQEPAIDGIEGTTFNSAAAALSAGGSGILMDSTSAANSAMAQYIVNAAVASSGTRIKKIKSKRTWSKEEEDALIEGLKEVGPSWSKILDMYGPGGKISEDLKNRTQVQLKDKARNWKLHYLKTGKPLPFYLVKVTGTLDKSVKAKKRNTAANSSIPDSNNSMEPSSSQQNNNLNGDTNQSQEPAGALFENNSTTNDAFDPSLETTM